MLCSVYALILAVSITSDCPQQSSWEVSYQALHAYDYAQTVQTARSPLCYSEEDPLTRTIIGRHPSVGKVEAWWAAESMLHYSVSAWLERSADAEGGKGWYAAKYAWHVLGIGMEARAVIHNSRIRLHPFGGDRCPPRQTIQERIK